MGRLTRREAILGLGAAGLGAAGLAAPLQAAAQTLAFAPGAIIRTLFADVPPDSLGGGATLFHEHLSLGPDFNERFRAAGAAVLAAQGRPASAAAGPPPATGPDPMRDVGLMAEELRSARRDGVACLVDAGLEGTGMDIEFIRAAAKASGLPVVKGAGFYTEPFYPKAVMTMSEDQIVQALIRQADTYPAGAFGEIGSWDEITATERKVFRAVGRAHRATNLPVFTHTGIPGKSALEQLDILEDAGVDPRRVAIGHLGNLNDPQAYVHKTVCRRGAYVGIDRQGGGFDDAVVPLVMALIDAGFADHVLISGDASRGYARPLTRFVPKLKAAGAKDDVLHRITVDNPRRFLAFTPKRPRPPTRA
jgi:phosphotriesterase-related protein